jgi:hypothetical protein
MLKALGAEERFVHACYHAALGDVQPRLMPMRDVAQIFFGKDLDMDRVWQVMTESSGGAVVARAVNLTWREFELPAGIDIARWAASYQFTRRELSDFAVYGGESTYAAKSAAALRAIPTFGDKARFLLALLAPEPAYVAARHTSAIGRLARGIGQVRRARRPS